jgi:hypothetical protein
MKVRFALFSITAGCTTVFLASAFAQTLDPPSRQQISPKVTFPADVKLADPTSDPFGRPFPQSGLFRVPTHDWRIQNDEAGIAPIVHELGNAKSDSERESVKTRLSEELEKAFATRQKRHLKELEALEAKVKELKDLVAKRQENRREIIANRRDQILREAQGLGW